MEMCDVCNGLQSIRGFVVWKQFLCNDFCWGVSDWWIMDWNWQTKLCRSYKIMMDRGRVDKEGTV